MLRGRNLASRARPVNLVVTDRISLSFPNRSILESVTVGLNESDRVGLVGRNGGGKSSLLKLLARRIEPDSGSVVVRGGTSVLLLEQADDSSAQETVETRAFGDLDFDWNRSASARDVVANLLDAIALDLPLSQLSGGQRRRVELARALMLQPDVLLLDEPTNHLDVTATAWLAEHLKHSFRSDSAVLVVTHDRWFLDAVCQETWELQRATISRFEGGYASYIQQRAERAQRDAVIAAKRKNLLRKELAWLGRGAPARTSKPKFRIDAALELIGQEPPPRDSIALARLATTRLGKDVFEFQRASYQIEGGRTILSDLDWLVGPGDRVGILGANGVGKTTLAMMTIGALEASSGRVRLGKTVRPAILSQSLGELSERSADRVFELLAREKLTFQSEAGEVGIGQVLEQLGFDSEALQTRVGELSGGQRRRLQLIRLLFGEPNLLVLDEPTNDFDTDMLTALEDLLDSWPGTLLVISHDRYFIERVTDTQYALLGDGKLRHLPRGVDEYLELKSRVGQRDSTVSTSAGFGPAKDLGKQALSGGERRELEKLLGRLERSVGKLTHEIAEVDAKLLTAPGSDYELLQQLAEERARLSAQLVDAEREWVQTAELLEA